MIKIISILFLLFLSTCMFGKTVSALNNNIKTNIDLLNNTLKNIIVDKKNKEVELSNILKLYYENYDKIVAFELTSKTNTLYSSYKDDEYMAVLKDTPLEDNFSKTTDYYKKDIINSKGKVLGTLTVYFKTELNFTQEELTYLQNKRVLRIQNDSNLAPYNFLENNIAKGFSIDYMSLIANKLALEVEYVPGNWNDFITMLKNNELDMMINVLKSEKREKFFLFSDLPYESLYPSMITRIDEKNINSFKKVKDETIALVKGYYSYDKVKKEYPNVKVLDTYNTFEMIQAVSKNEADIAYGLNTIVEYNINKHRLTNLKLTRNIDDNILHFYFAYNKESEILKNLIRKAEKAISKEEIQALRDKWLKKINLTKQKGNSFLFTKNEIEYLDKKKTITMCVDPNFMPFEKVNEKGQYIGIIADFMNTLSKNTSIKFELLGKTSWRDTLNLMKNKKCDIIPFIVETNKRKEYINFTQSYLTLPLVIATKNSEMFITNLESIKHKKIALVKDFATNDLIKLKYPDINIVQVKNIKEGLTKVNNDEAYAYLDTLPNVVYSIQKDNFSDIRISGKTFMDMDVKIGVRNDEVILQNILNKAIKTLDEETKNNIINKWLTIVKDKTFNMVLFIKIFSIVFLIFISIILFIIIRSNRSLSLVNKELEILSTTDKLTQINNRSKIDEIIQQEIDLSQRYNNDLCLIMADIDFFKKINDNYGHIRGDSVLKEFSTILSQNIRKTDFIGRWGGEEFMIVCPQTNKEHTFRLAEKLRKLVESYNFKKSIKITSSFGIYQYQQGDSLKTCIKHVDDALYEAKNSNRNCVKIFEAKEEN